MQNYEVGINGTGGVPDNPRVQPQADDKAEQDKAAVQQELTKAINGSAEKILKVAIDTGVAALMGFEKTKSDDEPQLSETDQYIMEQLEKDIEARKAYEEQIREMEKLDAETKEMQAKIDAQVKEDFKIPNKIEEIAMGEDTDDEGFEDDVDPEFRLKDLAEYYNEFIEENDGEPLSKAQIKAKMKEIEQELDNDSPMTDLEYQELQRKRNVLIDMMHGETY